MNQGRIERFLLDSIREHSDLDVERSVIADSLEYDEKLSNDPDAYPITVKVRVLGEDDSNSSCGQETEVAGIEVNRSNLLPDDWADLAPRKKPQKTQVETIRAKYLIGCDGAHSWTRKQLNIPVEGSNTDHIWLVVDITHPCYSS